MALIQVLVKVCGLTRPEDVEAAAEAGADMLGFVKEPSSPRYVSDHHPVWQFHRLAPYIPFCAVFGPFNPYCRLQGFSHVQSTDDLPGGLGLRSVKVLPVQPDDTPVSLLARAIGYPIVLLDKASPLHGGTGQPIDWGVAAEFTAAFVGRVVLAGGLGPDNVAEAVRNVKPYAVDASSRLELGPGIKDHEKLKAFVDRAKSAL